MNKHLSVAALSIFIAACASSGPEAPADTAQAMDVDTATSTDAPADGIEMAEAPETQVAASAASDSSSEMICRRERPIGSNMMVRVCRSRAEIEAREQRDQDEMRRMQTIRTGSERALQGQ